MVQTEPVQVRNPQTGYYESRSVEVGLSKGQTGGVVGGQYVVRPSGSPTSEVYIVPPSRGASGAATPAQFMGRAAVNRRIQAEAAAQQQAQQQAEKEEKMSVSTMDRLRQKYGGLEFKRTPAFQLEMIRQPQRYGRSNEYVKAYQEVQQRQSGYKSPFTTHFENIFVPSLLSGNVKLITSPASQKRAAEEELTIERARYYESLKDTSPVATAKGIAGTVPAMGYGGGALFKGGSLVVRYGLKAGAKGAGATGLSKVAKVLGYTERAVEPAAVIGGLGYAAYDIHQTGKKEGLPGAAGKTAVMVASLPFGIAGWKDAGKGWSRALTFGRKEVSAPIIEPVLSGKTQFPETAAGTKMSQFLKSFKVGAGKKTRATSYESPFDFTGGDHGITVKRGVSGMELVNRAAPISSYGYHSTGERKGEKFTIEYPTTKTGKFKPGHKGDVPGLYVSPFRYGTSPFFLRVGQQGAYLRSLFNPRAWLQSESLSPTTLKIKLGGVERMPSGYRTDLNKAIAFLSPEGRAKKGTAYPTVALEKHLKVGGGKAEAEAVISPGTTLKRVGAKEFYQYKGYRIALDEYAAQFAPGKTKSNIIQMTKGKGENVYYRRSAIPTRPYTTGRTILDAIKEYSKPSNRYAGQQTRYPQRRTETPYRGIYEAFRSIYTPPGGRYTPPSRYSFGYTGGYTTRGTYTPPPSRPTPTPSIYIPQIKIPQPKIRLLGTTSPIFQTRSKKRGTKEKVIVTRMLSLSDLFRKRKK